MTKSKNSAQSKTLTKKGIRKRSVNKYGLGLSTSLLFSKTTRRLFGGVVQGANRKNGPIAIPE